MKIIAQVLAYEEADCIKRAIEPWLPVCARIDIFESAFQTMVGLGYPLRSQDGTVEICQRLQNENKNVRFEQHIEVNEPVLRNRHLWETCRDFGREDTVLFILDADEIYSSQEVASCVAQVKERFTNGPENTLWVNMKNYVNDESQYYLGFRVPRFFKLKTARGFSGYNDVCFTEGVFAADITNVLPRHISWAPPTKAQRKIRWQNSLGWSCSFAVENGNVVLNDDYYRETGKAKPVFIKE